MLVLSSKIIWKQPRRAASRFFNKTVNHINISMNNFYVYQYLREDQTPYYIGKGKDKRAYVNNRTIKKPTDPLRIEIVKDQLTERQAFDLEIELIALHGRKDIGTGILRNLTNGGEGVSGRVDTIETIQKRVSKNKGKTRTVEQKHRMSQAQKGRPSRIYTDEQKAEISRKISETHKGIPKSEEHKQKLSEFFTGKSTGPKSEETKQKMRKPKSEEHKKAISEARIAKYKALEDV